MKNDFKSKNQLFRTRTQTKKSYIDVINREVIELKDGILDKENEMNEKI